MILYIQNIFRQFIKGLYIINIWFYISLLILATIKMSAQNDSTFKVDKICYDLQIATQNLANQKKYDLLEIKNITNNIRNHANSLTDILIEHPECSTQDYLISLECDINQINNIISLNDTSDIRELLKDVEYDLSIKNSNGVTWSSNGVNSRVLVSVHTFRNGKEEGGYVVQATRKYLTTSNPMFPFNDLTSPSSRNLPPGYYLIWIEKNHTIMDKRVFTIGEENKDKQDIRFDIN